MYKSAIAGLFACAIIIAVSNSSTVNAEALNIEKITETGQPLTKVLQESIDSEKENKTPPPQAQPVSHVVQPEETLSNIATNYQTTWKRLFDKNTTIADPNIISVGQTVAIPTADEVLAERPMPIVAPEPAVATTTVKSSVATNRSTSYSAQRGSSAGNRYTPGYCTWYVKNMRPDLPNNLGNADTWVARAAAQGLATGSTPRVGAVGQQGMHVVYVESVNGDGTVTISEMNHAGLYVRTVRTVPASNFMYIY
jgi:surface antigen